MVELEQTIPRAIQSLSDVPVLLLNQPDFSLDTETNMAGMILYEDSLLSVLNHCLSLCLHVQKRETPLHLCSRSGNHEVVEVIFTSEKVAEHVKLSIINKATEVRYHLLQLIALLRQKVTV